MNFLKISSLLIGTGSVVGGTGAGIYYGVIKNNESYETAEVSKKTIEQKNKKSQFEGKLVFEKKSASPDNYEIKFFTTDEYTTKETKFDKDKSNNSEKYSAVNKVIEISLHLNIEEATRKLNDIFGESLTLEEIKSKISEKEEELKAFLSNDVYTKLQTKFGVLAI